MHRNALVEDQKAAFSRSFFSVAQKSHGLKDFRMGLFIFPFTILLVGREIFLVAPGQQKNANLRATV